MPEVQCETSPFVCDLALYNLFMSSVFFTYALFKMLTHISIWILEKDLNKAIPIFIFVSHYRSMAKPISQSGKKKKSEKKKTHLNVNK